jgi:hypothetical protein
MYEAGITRCKLLTRRALRFGYGSESGGGRFRDHDFGYARASIGQTRLVLVSINGLWSAARSSLCRQGSMASVVRGQARIP